MPTIKSENWDGVTAPAIPSGWTVDTELVTATTNSPTSSPNSLVYPVGSANTNLAPEATWATQDTNGGNVQVWATLRFANSGASAGDQDLWVFARANVVATAANFGSTLSCYMAGINRNGSAPGFVLQKKVAGVTTTLGRIASAPFADATNYRISLYCSGSTIQARAQRLSDSFWLTSSGSFVSDPSNTTWALSVTDTAIAAAAGYAGLGFYLLNGNGGAIGADDWLLETPPASIAATPTTLVAGSGNHTIALAGTNTAFSTSSSTQFTLSGGTGASLVSQSASSGTAATLVVNPGSAVGALTITDTTDGSITTTIAVTRAPATFYVSPSGSDSNSGTSTGAAWQTIGRVNAQTLVPGDQVLFQGGSSFSGNLVIANSGTAAAPILVGSYGSGQATISPGTGTGVQVLDADYVRVSGLTIAGPGVSATGATSSTTSTGTGLEVRSTQTQATIASWRQSVYVDNVSVWGCYWGVAIRAYGGSAAGPYPVGYNDIRITNCTVQNCAGAGIWVAATNAGVTLYSCLENGGAGNTTPYHKNVYVGSCTVRNIYGDSSYTLFYTGTGVALFNVGTALVERTLATNCAQACGGLTPGGGGPCAFIVYACNTCTFQYCEASSQHNPKNSDSVGFDIDGGCQHCTVQYCYSHDNDGSGLLAYAGGGSGANSSNVFRYNVSQNDARLLDTPVRDGGGAAATVFHNNTICATSPGATPYLVSVTSSAFYNNIFWCGSGVGLFTGTSGATFAGNLYFFVGGAFSAVYGGTTYTSLAAFRAVQETVGGQPTGLALDPQLVAPGAGGTYLPTHQPNVLASYSLGAGSPAIDAGLDLRVSVGLDPGVIDFLGRPNYAGAGYDIGACEYGAEALLAPGAGLRRVNLAGGIGG